MRKCKILHDQLRNVIDFEIFWSVHNDNKIKF